MLRRGGLLLWSGGVLLRPGGLQSHPLRPGGLLSHLICPGGLLHCLLRPGGFLLRLLSPGGLLYHLLHPGGLLFRPGLRFRSGSLLRLGSLLCPGFLLRQFCLGVLLGRLSLSPRSSCFHVDLAFRPSPCSASAPPPSWILLREERLEATPWGGGGISTWSLSRGLCFQVRNSWHSLFFYWRLSNSVALLRAPPSGLGVNCLYSS